MSDLQLSGYSDPYFPKGPCNYLVVTRLYESPGPGLGAVYDFQYCDKNNGLWYTLPAPHRDSGMVAYDYEAPFYTPRSYRVWRRMDPYTQYSAPSNVITLTLSAPGPGTE